MTQEEIDFFDRIAPTWDADEIRSTPERVTTILSRIGIRRGMRILDLGTGTGVLIPFLSQLTGPEGSVTGIDLSDGMLDRARAKYGHLANVRFLKIDFEEELIPDKYDLILMYSVYPHLHAPSDTFEWLFKMNMNADGYLVVAFPADEEFINNIHHDRKAEHEHLPSAGRLAAIFRSWGYESEAIAETKDEYIVTVRRPVQ